MCRKPCRGKDEQHTSNRRRQSASIVSQCNGERFLCAGLILKSLYAVGKRTYQQIRHEASAESKEDSTDAILSNNHEAMVPWRPVRGRGITIGGDRLSGDLHPAIIL